MADMYVGDVYKPLPSNPKYANLDMVYLQPQSQKSNEVAPYVWDGKSRPNINDYTAPWSKKASETMYKYTWTDSRRKHNAAVTYAKNQLQAALAQYDADLAFWQEQDERRYTSQAAQAQRYEDAGFNMGYVYGSVDNGNSAVGYNPTSSDFKPSENEGDDIGGIKLIVDCVTSALALVTPLVSSGISLAKLPYELAQIKAGTANLKAQASLAEIRAQLESFLQSHDDNGDPVDDLGKSLAFAMERIQYDLHVNQTNLAFETVEDLRKWNKVAEEIYKLQSTPDASQAYNSWINSLDMPDWCKAVCIVLGAVVGVAGKGLAGNLGKSGKSGKSNKLTLPSGK